MTERIETAIQIIGFLIYFALYGVVGILSSIYVLDFIHELVTDFRWILILLGILGTLILALIGAGIGATYSAMKSSSPTVSRTIMALSPLGLIVVFFVWQFENWLVFDVFDIDPWLYNGVFQHIGLAV